MQIAAELCKYIGVCGFSRLHAVSVDSVHYVHTECKVNLEKNETVQHWSWKAFINSERA